MSGLKAVGGVPTNAVPNVSSHTGSTSRPLRERFALRLWIFISPAGPMTSDAPPNGTPACVTTLVAEINSRLGSTLATTHPLFRKPNGGLLSLSSDSTTPELKLKKFADQLRRPVEFEF